MNALPRSRRRSCRRFFYYVLVSKTAALDSGEVHDLVTWRLAGTRPAPTPVVGPRWLIDPRIMRWLKAATGNRANKLIGRTRTPFWQREYYDRWIRSEKELSTVIAYVEDNPVRSGLAANPEEWRWSSAFKEPAARPPA